MAVELTEDAQQLLQSLVDKHQNDMSKVAMELFGENYKYREKNRQLRAKIPAEGSVVLTSEEAALWDQYKNLGPVEDIQSKLSRVPELETTITSMQREQQIAGVAQISGAASKVLKDRIEASENELVFETRKDDSDNEVVFVRENADGSQFVPLKEYASTKWAEYVPALWPVQNQPASGQGTRGFPPQSGGSQTPARNPVDKYIEERNAASKTATNPLLK